MFKKKYLISNEALDLTFTYRTKRKAKKVQRRLIENSYNPIAFEDKWLLHNLDTGELVR